MQDERKPAGTPGTSEVEATPDTGERRDAPTPGETPGTAETEATPDANAPKEPRRGA